MKTLTLGINDRLLIKSVLLGLRGGADILRQIFRVVDIVDLSEEEEKKINLRQEGMKLLWDDDEEINTKFKFEDADFEFMKKHVNAKNDYPADKRTIALIDKINKKE